MCASIAAGNTHQIQQRLDHAGGVATFVEHAAVCLFFASALRIAGGAGDLRMFQVLFRDLRLRAVWSQARIATACGLIVLRVIQQRRTHFLKKLLHLSAFFETLLVPENAVRVGQILDLALTQQDLEIRRLLFMRDQLRAVFVQPPARIYLEAACYRAAVAGDGVGLTWICVFPELMEVLMLPGSAFPGELLYAVVVRDHDALLEFLLEDPRFLAAVVCPPALEGYYDTLRCVVTQGRSRIFEIFLECPALRQAISAEMLGALLILAAGGGQRTVLHQILQHHCMLQVFLQRKMRYAVRTAFYQAIVAGHTRTLDLLFQHPALLSALKPQILEVLAVRPALSAVVRTGLWKLALALYQVLPDRTQWVLHRFIQDPPPHEAWEWLAALPDTRENWELFDRVRIAWAPYLSCADLLSALYDRVVHRASLDAARRLCAELQSAELTLLSPCARDPYDSLFVQIAQRVVVAEDPQEQQHYPAILEYLVRFDMLAACSVTDQMQRYTDTIQDQPEAEPCEKVRQVLFSVVLGECLAAADRVLVRRVF